MSAFRVIEPGLSSTIQDLGRPGHSAMGVPGGGAADTMSLRLGNRLVGNDPGAPAIELTLTGGVFLLEGDARVAVTGARVHGTIEGAGSPAQAWRGWSCVEVRGGELLRIGAAEQGCRAYLCIGGGVRVPNVMGSASTLLGAGFGGHDGRALKRGDLVEFRGARPAVACAMSESGALLAHEVHARRVIRAVPGAHAAAFNLEGAAIFWGSSFSVSEHSDRVGLRLRGPSVASPLGGRMVSEGMMWGAVQVPEDGRPIVLMCDHPTTGGYPVIACVASVDLPVLGQLRPRDEVRFEAVTVEQAWALHRVQEHRIAGGVLIP